MTEKLSAAARDAMLGPLFQNGWAMIEDRDAISKTYQFTSFVDAMGWMMRAAIWAEKWDHHPEWFNVYNRIDVVLTTHDVGGLSALDAKLARKLDTL